MSDEQRSLISSANCSMMPSTSRQEKNSDDYSESRKRNNPSTATTSSHMSSSQPKKQRPSIPPVGDTFLSQEADLSEECRPKYERWARKQKMLWSPVKQISSYHKERISELETHQIPENSSGKMDTELKAVEQQRFDFDDAIITSTSSTSEDSIVVDASEGTIEKNEQIKSVLEPWEEALIRGLMKSFLPINRDPQAIYAYAVLKPKEYLQKLPTL